METFVETPRYFGTDYGRVRNDRYKRFDKPRKAIWLKPLCKDWERTLNRQKHPETKRIWFSWFHDLHNDDNTLISKDPHQSKLI